MNVFAYERITPNSSFPWFEDYAQHNTFCKVYNDGGSYVAIPQLKPSVRKPRRAVRNAEDELFEQFYLEGIEGHLSGEALAEYIVSKIREMRPDFWGVRDFVDEKLLGKRKNLSARKKRFRRKAYLNEWNYFVTFTYDDELQSEESFKKRLRKSLSNMHTRRGWLYMGVFEHAPDTGRLHFHAIMYVPEGAMVGEIYERKDYSTKYHKMQITHPNTFFEERFGRCDFEKLSAAQLRQGATLNYLLKYLEKTEERIVYSRGIPTEFFKEINDSDVICEMVDFVTKYVLFNEVIDYEIDVKRTKKPQTVFFVPPLPS